MLNPFIDENYKILEMYIASLCQYQRKIHRIGVPDDIFVDRQMKDVFDYKPAAFSGGEIFDRVQDQIFVVFGVKKACDDDHIILTEISTVPLFPDPVNELVIQYAAFINCIVDAASPRDDFEIGKLGEVADVFYGKLHFFLRTVDYFIAC